MAFQHVKQVIDLFSYHLDQQPGLNLYAVLDGARNSYIYPTLMATGAVNRCLYAGHQLLYLGKMPQALAAVAPYIVQLKPDSPFARWIVKEGWGDHWGIFLTSTANLTELLRHFRRFVMVKEESGRLLYFRFYDPRVFRPYLPTCNEADLEMIFGPVDRFYIEAADSAQLLELRRENSLLELRTVDLTEPRERDWLV